MPSSKNRIWADLVSVLFFEVDIQLWMSPHIMLKNATNAFTSTCHTVAAYLTSPEVLVSQTFATLWIPVKKPHPWLWKNWVEGNWLGRHRICLRTFTCDTSSRVGGKIWLVSLKNWVIISFCRSRWDCHQPTRKGSTPRSLSRASPIASLEKPTWWWLEKKTFGSKNFNFQKVSSLSFGASSLGGVFKATDDSESAGLVKRVLQQGINYIDTAPWWNHWN